MSNKEKGQTNGWHEWSKFVLKELERLNMNQEKATGEMKAYADQMRSIVEQCNRNHREEQMRLEKERKEQFEKTHKTMQAAFKRIDKLESWKDKMTAGMTVISLLVTTAWGKLLRLI